MSPFGLTLRLSSGVIGRQISLTAPTACLYVNTCMYEDSTSRVLSSPALDASEIQILNGPQLVPLSSVVGSPPGESVVELGRACMHLLTP